MGDLSDAADRFAHLAQALAAGPGPTRVRLQNSEDTYSVLAHHPEIARRLRPTYHAEDLRAWAGWLESHGTTQLELTRQGLIRAADRVHEDTEDTIQYDAIWVRDAAWGVLALLATRGREADAGRVVRQLLRSFATPLQLARFESVCADPSLVGPHTPDAGMNAVHIRFDGRSPTYEDIEKDGRPQRWNHKQNDALGLFLIALERCCARGALDAASFSQPEWQALVRFAPYFTAIGYDACEDAGAWEEIERLNTSSVGIVAHALEVLAAGLAAGHGPLFTGWQKQLTVEPAAIVFANQPEALRAASARGLARVRRQLPLGESPGYPAGSPQYREADAALLNLIAPAPLGGLTPEERQRVLAHVGKLVRPAGVLRYVGDSYQSANAWFLAPWPEAPAAGAAMAQAQEATSHPSISATASGQAFLERARGFVPGTEAQWFFDSWLAWAHAEVFLTEGKPADRLAAVRHFNRALGQITAGDVVWGADGRPGMGAALPESYNTLLLPDRSRHLVPSPVLPLNWAKASLILAMEALGRLTEAT